MTLHGAQEHSESPFGGHCTNLHITTDQIFGTNDQITKEHKTHLSSYAYVLLYVSSSSEIQYPACPNGLENPRRSNRCYFNAALQLLWCGPPLVPDVTVATSGGQSSRILDDTEYRSDTRDGGVFWAGGRAYMGIPESAGLDLNLQTISTPHNVSEPSAKRQKQNEVPDFATPSQAPTTLLQQIYVQKGCCNPSSSCDSTRYQGLRQCPKCDHYFHHFCRAPSEHEQHSKDVCCHCTPSA